MISAFLPKIPGMPARLTVTMSAILCALSPVGSAHTLIGSDFPGGADNWAWCAVNRGKEVGFYRYAVAGPRRGVLPFEVFHPPVTADEIIYSGERLGMRTGRSLQFFDTLASFRHLPQFDFQLPAGTSELLL